MKSILLSVRPEWTAKILNGEKTIEYKKLKKTYFNMHARCENPKASRYERYGGRGINVCDKWSGKDGFRNFLYWALENGYFCGASIERIDIEKGYSPDNCKWIPLNEQSINTRRTHFVTHDGRTMCLEHWCKELGIPSTTIFYRVHSQGYSYEDALFDYRPKQKGYKTCCPHGHEYTKENTMINSQGYQICKTCYLESREKYNAKRREKRRCQKRY